MPLRDSKVYQPYPSLNALMVPLRHIVMQLCRATRRATSLNILPTQSSGYIVFWFLHHRLDLYVYTFRDSNTISRDDKVDARV